MFFLANSGPTTTKLYSPNGMCNQTLAPFAAWSNIERAVMMLLNKQVLACGGLHNLNCYMYDVLTNTWSIYSNATRSHNYGGVVHNRKIYLTDYSKPEVFDPSSKLWSTWPVAPTDESFSCYVSWKNYIIKFGGYSYASALQVWRFDPTTNNWLILNTTPPFYLYNSGCTVLPNENVLVTGCELSPNCYKSIAEYNVTANTWPSVINGSEILYNSISMVLGKRAFIIPSSSSKLVQEYFFENKTVVKISEPFISYVSSTSPSIAIPADWFIKFPGMCIGIY